MSFDAFVIHKGLDIKKTTREEAIYYLDRHGTVSCLKDYLWLSPARDAFWKAIGWTEQSTDKNNSLHYRCSAVRKARAEWYRFQQNVEPIEPMEPMVPPLPE